MPQDEFTRLRALHASNLLDTQPDVRFDCITQFAANTLDAPICLITLIDISRQWPKSTYGINKIEIPRKISICAHAICEIKSTNLKDRIYEIYDTKSDIRFFDNPQVAGKPWIRSYISYVLQSESGKNIGTLCLFDTSPRIFTFHERRMVSILGAMVENIIYGHHFSTSIEYELNKLP